MSAKRPPVATLSVMPRGTGQADTDSADVRTRLTRTALRLFAEQGYAATTVDHLADAAGVNRRTFFRYFSSKEDVVFPDHEPVLARIRWYLDSTLGMDPLAALAEATRLIFESAVADPDHAMAIFGLTRDVPALRDREIVAATRYERLLSSYLRTRLSTVEDAALWSHVIAAALMAAHNQVLREWLRSDGQMDARPRLRAVLAQVVETMRPMIPNENGT